MGDDPEFMPLGWLVISAIIGLVAVLLFGPSIAFPTG